MDNDHNISFDILTDAVREMGEQGVTKNDVLPTLLDFAATNSVALSGARLG
jgi:hypothetical protein